MRHYGQQWGMESMSIFVSIAALVISAISYWFARHSWIESNRPLVTVAVRTVSSGNQGTALQLVVSNTGNRPARDVQLLVDSGALSALLVDDRSSATVASIERVFSREHSIPVLANGESVQNSFGFLSAGSSNTTWKGDSSLPVTVTYSDLGTGRSFRETQRLRIAENTGFARGTWEVKHSSLRQIGKP